MNALLIWVLLPGVVGVGLYVFRRYDRLVHVGAIGVCLLLSSLAWLLPIDAPIILRLVRVLPAIRVVSEFNFLGGVFRLDDSLRPAMALLYLSAAFWFGGAYTARTHRLFVPIGMAIAALMTAALGAESIATAALIVELVALLCVPLLSAPGEPMRRGVLRFLVYQTGGVCLILFAEALLAGGGVAFDDVSPLNGSFFILLLGFALLLGVTPFHTWMPMLAEEGRPYSALFVFYVIPSAAALLALELLFGIVPIGLAPTLLVLMRYAGVLMVLVGGLAAAFERHLGRVAGFAALAQMGMTILAVSLNDALGRSDAVGGLFFAQLLPQGIGLALCGLALSILRFRLGDLRFRTVSGAARRFPVAGAAVVLALFSMAGVPILAGFPVYMALWAQLGLRSLPVALLSLLGSLGLLAAGLRVMAVLVMGGPAVAGAQAAAGVPATAGAGTVTVAQAATGVAAPEEAAAPAPRWQVGETSLQVLLLSCGLALLLLAGIFPQAYFPTIINMAIQFIGTGP